MRKAFLYVIALLIGTVSISAQQYNKAELDSLIADYVKHDMYGSASLQMVRYAVELQNHGDLEQALEYQIKNCELIEQHIDFFVQQGLTLRDLLNHYSSVMVLQRDLRQDTLAIKTYIEIAKIVNQYSRSDLPYFTDMIASTIGLCRTQPYAESAYMLQNALDVIAEQPISRENVEKYVRFNQCFSTNRMFNSYDGSIFTINRVNEIKKWYKKNCSYIHGLDTNIYKSKIIEFEKDYADKLYFYAGQVSTRQNNWLEAIELYDESASVLATISSWNDTIPQMMASCYARIASCYYIIGNKRNSKEYSDKVFPFLYNHIDNDRCVDILHTLASNYYNLNQYSLAAKTQQEIIELKKRLGEKVSITDWTSYFLYMVNENPEEVINNRKIINDTVVSKIGNPSYAFYLILGRAYSSLMSESTHYKDSVESCFHKADSIISANEDFYRNLNQLGIARHNLYAEYATHYSRQNNEILAYEFSKKALNYCSQIYTGYYKVSLEASFLHDRDGIHEYLPKYYSGLEDELSNMLPILGSVESDTYLQDGEATLYHIPEWASWNPTDSVSVSIAYNAVLLMKGLTLRYNSLAPYYEKYPEIVTSKTKLDRMRDSIYAISDDNNRLLALHRYQIEEREILKEVNHEMINVHWEDIYRGLKEDEACIEFVKYKKNAYSWCEGVSTPHYVALILSTKTSFPVFVDLFDESELADVYNLQPKSYDTGMGTSLYSKIWGVLKKYIEGKSRVYFSPSGLLNLINIENLTNDTSKKTALEEFNLYRVSSTKRILDVKDKMDITSIASFGGIDYKDSSEYADITNMMNTRGNWNFLQNTLSEVSHIKEYFNNKVKVSIFTGKNATESAFKSLDGTNSNLIHIASHGYYIPQSSRNSLPYFKNSDYTKAVQDELFYSGIVLSGGQKSWVHSSYGPDNNDGILSSYEISKLDLHNVDLVVLSACETGLGDNLYDGIYGLQRAFKKAGAKSILMSLWQIDDKATSEYMSLFYKKLSNGSSIHDAYVGTVLDMKKKYVDPYYWASFVLLD